MTVDKDINEILDKALKKLFTLKDIKSKEVKTSQYDFGIHEPVVQDRCTLHIELRPDFVLKCQLVFDSKDYSFPPDIIFQNLPDPLISTDLSTLLPLKDWNLENENCLYNWVERIVKFFDKVLEDKDQDKSTAQESTKRKFEYSDIQFDDNAYDDYMLSHDLEEEKEASEKKDEVEEKKPAPRNVRRKLLQKSKVKDDDDDDSMFEKNPPYTSKKPDKTPPSLSSAIKSTEEAKKRKMSITTELDDSDDLIVLPPKKSTITKLFDLGPSQTSSRATSEGSNIIANREYRKEFMSEWLQRYRTYIVGYDAEQFKHFTLRITFGITSSNPLWQKYLHTVHKKVEGESDFFKQKLQAPVLIEIKMDSSFPQTDLEIKLISVVNTTELNNTEPEFMTLDYAVFRSDPFSQIIADMMRVIQEKAIPFHLQMKSINF